MMTLITCAELDPKRLPIHLQTRERAHGLVYHRFDTMEQARAFVAKRNRFCTRWCMPCLGEPEERVWSPEIIAKTVMHYHRLEVEA